MPVLKPQIFKANDIRGVVGDEWDVAGARALGLAYAQIMPDRRIVVSRDMRVTGPEIQTAFIDGVTAGGVSVVDVGLASTDGLWFAAGLLDLPGVQVTSSHNPSRYNGLKFCLAQAKPVSPEFLARLAELAQSIDAGEVAPPLAQPGTVEQRDVLDDYVAFLLSRVDLDGMRHLKVVVDAGNGMGGHTAPAVFSHLDVELIGLFLDLDGSFPNHQPNPLAPENLVDAQAMVRQTGADLAIVFDGDADRAFVIDERGEVVPPSAITAMIAVQELQSEPQATIVINTITSSAVPEIVAEHGGKVVESRVGHTYMKALMAEHGAVFGGEHSAHYYFRDFFGADTGMLAALHVMASLGRSDQPLSVLAGQFSRYVGSGEINSEVADQQGEMEKVAAALTDHGTAAGVEARWGDGVKIVGADWWVSLRPSNTEPLLRLNVEARETAVMEEFRDRVLALIREA
ncbi:MAG: phosphomannomutase/phosphoglucomutase [Propionibacteriaceae bacterium]|jgi:phosphomannomutase|nr:phosphomannomutase/phosphoglucomutase [Propionibacteriaceae bacterium]